MKYHPDWRSLEYAYDIPGRGVKTTSKGCPGYDTKLHMVMRLQFCKAVEWEISFMIIIPKSTLIL